MSERCNTAGKWFVLLIASLFVSILSVCLWVKVSMQALLIMAYHGLSDLHSVNASLFTKFDVHKNTLDFSVLVSSGVVCDRPDIVCVRPNSPNVNWYIRKCPINFFINGYNAFWVSSVGRCASLSMAIQTCAPSHPHPHTHTHAQTLNYSQRQINKELLTHT